MLRLTVLSILLCLALGGHHKGHRKLDHHGHHKHLKNSKMINYENCYSTYGGEGVNFTCNQGYVATGACGSETMKKCNSNSESAGLRCCEIDVAGGAQTGCTWLYGDKGQRIECTGNQTVFGTCGSGGSDECGDNKTSAIQCCDSAVEAIKDNSTCSWHNGGNGANAECAYGQVLVGRCGSRDLAQCSSSAHSIYCCNISEKRAENRSESASNSTTPTST